MTEKAVRVRASVIGIMFAILPLSDFASADTRQQVIGISRGDSLNVRSGPGAKFRDVGDILRNAYVEVLGYDASGRWAKVLWRGRERWVSAKFLSGGIGGKSGVASVSGSSLVPGMGRHTVTGIPANDPIGGLALRDGPGKSFKLTQVIGNGVDVFVVSRSPNNKWAFIRFSNGTGHVSTAFLKPKNGAGKVRPKKPNPSQSTSGRSSFPSVFSVAGVASNDKLYIRKSPLASSSRIGAFAPDAAVVVLAMRANGWAKVSVGETVGYVNSKFLRSGGGTKTASGMQTGLMCRGTEPFWSLAVDSNLAVRYSALIGGSDPVATLTQATPSSTPGTFTFAAAPYAGTLTAALCSDGMSDTAYGFRLKLIRPDQNGSPQTLNGCCNLQ